MTRLGRPALPAAVALLLLLLAPASGPALAQGPSQGPAHGRSSIFSTFENGFSLPPEVVSFRAICAEFRSRVALKLRDMRQNYQTFEVTPGDVEFRNALGERIADVKLQRSLSEDKKNRVEWVRYYDATRSVILEERTETAGAGLEYSAPATRLFFEGESDYDLSPNENVKSIYLGTGGNPIFRFLIRRGDKDADGGVETRYEIFFGYTQMITIRRYERPTGVRVEYEFHLGSGTITNGTASITISQSQSNIFRIVVEKPQNFVSNSTRFFWNDQEVFGTLSFVGRFNPFIYNSFLLQGVAPAADQIVVPLFPSTTRLANLVAGGKFLDDLIRLKTIVDQSKTNPALLTQVTTLVGSFIASVQDGTLTITDNRPKK